jgi:hypothetical protein
MHAPRSLSPSGPLNFVTISFPFYIYYYFTKRSHKEEEEEHSIWQARNEAISKGD